MLCYVMSFIYSIACCLGTEIAGYNESLHTLGHECKTCDFYQDEWDKHEVYCDEPGPPCEFALDS